MIISDDVRIGLVIGLAALATYTLRAGGLLLSEKLPDKGGFKRFLDALPGTILLSLVTPGILAFGKIGLLAAAATAICAYRTGNLFLSMLIGMFVIVIHRNLL
jgi:uncharacterized membrane protein